MTNGEMIQKVFNCEVCEPIPEDDIIHVIFSDKNDSAIGFDWSWWSTEYKEPTTKNNLSSELEKNSKKLEKNFGESDCISRAEVLKLMQDNWHTHNGDWAMQESMDDIRALLSVTPQEPRWIPVSERLPNWDTDCLVIDGDGECGVGYYREDVHAWDSPNWGWLERKDRVDNKEAFTEPCGIGKVVAWMPLPKPYEPQESEKI